MSRKKHNAIQEVTSRENKIDSGENTRSDHIVKCAIRGCIPCPNTECDGLNRKCSKWINHSAR